jgi:hypothetical protein
MGPETKIDSHWMMSEDGDHIGRQMTDDEFVSV